MAAAPIIRWAYYVTYAKDSFTALQANVGALSMVSPYYFELEADGTIKNFEEADTNTMLRAARVKIIPMVKNAAHNADFTAQMATPEARDKMAATIADLVVPRNYDGINVDFEDVRPEDRALLTDTDVAHRGEDPPFRQTGHAGDRRQGERFDHRLRRRF